MRKRIFRIPLFSPQRSGGTLCVDAVASYAGGDDQENGMRGNIHYFAERRMALGEILCELGQNSEECHCSEENPAIRINKVGRLDEHQCCRSDKTDDRKTQHAKRLREIGIVLKMRAQPEIGTADSQHDDEARQDDGEGGEQTAPYRAGSRISNVGGAVDADGSRRDLAHGNDVHKLLLRHPAVLLHLDLNKRQDSQTSAEAEETYLEERYEELKVEHG